MRLFLQANGFIDVFPPATYPTDQVQRKCLAAPVTYLCRQLVRLP